MPVDAARTLLLAAREGGAPLIAGITGHQDLGEAGDWVRDVLRAESQRRDVTRGLTSLAVGADQTFAEVMAALGLPYEAIIPCSGYENTFADDPARDRFHRLRAGAAHVEQLPFGEPSERAFMEAGRYIVTHCEMLFAVWNGLPARGLGGTADIVSLAESVGQPWVHINPIDRTVNSR